MRIILSVYFLRYFSKFQTCPNPTVPYQATTDPCLKTLNLTEDEEEEEEEKESPNLPSEIVVDDSSTVSDEDNAAQSYPEVTPG